MARFPDLERQLPSWLEKQRWFSNDAGAIDDVSILNNDWVVERKLLWLLVRAGSATYQVLVGFSLPEDLGGTLLGHGNATIGELDINGDNVVAYDALIDNELCKVLFEKVVGGTAKTARPISAEQSNTSIIYDDKLIVKFFRRLHEGSNPDLEVTLKLTEAGFTHVAPVVATWQRDNYDLAVCQPYLQDGTEGWKLALASVRDFLGADIKGASSAAGSPSVRLDATDPAAAGGDFANEARRLGEVTAHMHLALADQFGAEPFDPGVLVRSLEFSLDGLDHDRRRSVQGLIDELVELSIGDAGLQTRVHGDYHLGQTLRSVTGWYIFDFEGEPARPLADRVRPTSPMKDVAGMVRSFGYAASSNLFDWIEEEQNELRSLADAWEVRNREAFREAYMCVDGISRLLPETAAAADLVFRGFEVEKALYELAYEKAYRPTWVAIPERALDRLLSS